MGQRLACHQAAVCILGERVATGRCTPRVRIGGKPHVSRPGERPPPAASTDDEQIRPRIGGPRSGSAWHTGQAPAALRGLGRVPTGGVHGVSRTLAFRLSARRPGPAGICLVGGSSGRVAQPAGISAKIRGCGGRQGGWTASRRSSDACCELSRSLRRVLRPCGSQQDASDGGSPTMCPRAGHWPRYSGRAVKTTLAPRNTSVPSARRATHSRRVIGLSGRASMTCTSAITSSPT